MQPEPAKRVNTENARERMLAGVKVGYDVVSATFGPRSANVAIKRPFGAPAVIHDGVNVFRSIFPLPDDEMDAGAEIAFEAASQTAQIGDGTTLSTILTWEIAREAHKRITAGARPMALREGIDLASATVQSELTKLRKPIDVKKDADKLLMVATISAQVADIGQMVATAYEKLGRNGILTVEESRTADSSLELKTGMQFDKGWLTPYFVDQGNRYGEANLGDATIPARILVTDLYLRDLEQFHEMMQRLMEGGVKHLAIVASGFDVGVASYFVKNHLKGAFKGVLIEAPAYGEKRIEMLRDIAIMIGGDFISEAAGVGLQSVTAQNLGFAKRLTTTKETTLIVGAEVPIVSAEFVKAVAKEVQARVEEINGQLKNNDLSAFDREKLNERLARLDSGIGVLNIGAPTEPEMKERKERAIDAIAAARAALSDGIVPGGGTALRVASEAAQKALKKQLNDAEFDVRSGADVIFRACQAPFRKLMSNAGYDPGYKLAKVEDKPVGYGVDVMDGQIVDMIEAGIIDPLLVISGALKNATSAAMAIATSEGLVTEEPTV